MDMKQFFQGTPAQIQTLSPYSKGQVKGMDLLRQSGFDLFANPTRGFDPLAQEARGEFQRKTIPSLYERLLGASGDLGSSALPQQLGEAGSRLDESLAASKAQYGLQNQAQALQMIFGGLQPQFQFMQTPGEQGFASTLLPMAIQAGLGYLTGGGAGALMSGLGGMFGKPSQRPQTEFGQRLLANQFGAIQGLYRPSFGGGFMNPGMATGSAFSNPLFGGNY